MNLPSAKGNDVELKDGRENVAERLLIIGASGFVGSRLAIAADRVFTVIRGSRSLSAVNDTAATESVAIDIADAASVQAAFEQACPDVVVLLAAGGMRRIRASTFRSRCK